MPIFVLTFKTRNGKQMRVDDLKAPSGNKNCTIISGPKCVQTQYYMSMMVILQLYFFRDAPIFKTLTIRPRPKQYVHIEQTLAIIHKINSSIALTCFLNIGRGYFKR